MAEFTTGFQSLRPSFPFLDIDPNLELINQFTGMMSPPVFMDNSNLNVHTIIPFPYQEPSDFAANLEGPRFPILPEENEIQESQKRKSMDATDTISSVNPSTANSESGGTKIITVCYCFSYYPFHGFFYKFLTL